MKKTIFLFFAITCSLLLAGKEKSKLTLVLDNNTNQYREYSKVDYSYNKKGFVEKEHHLLWDKYKNRWYNSNIINFVYEDKQLKSSLILEYYAPLEKWIKLFESEFIYEKDSVVELKKIFVETEKMSSWNNFIKVVSIKKDNKIVAKKEYRWNKTKKEYELTEEELFYYNAKGDNIKTVVNGFHTTTWDEHSTYEYLYDKKHRVVQTIFTDKAHKKINIITYKHIYY